MAGSHMPTMDTAMSPDASCSKRPEGPLTSIASLQTIIELRSALSGLISAHPEQTFLSSLRPSALAFLSSYSRTLTAYPRALTRSSSPGPR